MSSECVLSWYPGNAVGSSGSWVYGMDTEIGRNWQMKIDKCGHQKHVQYVTYNFIVRGVPVNNDVGANGPSIHPVMVVGMYRCLLYGLS
jgi:hypothetical protein